MPKSQFQTKYMKNIGHFYNNIGNIGSIGKIGKIGQLGTLSKSSLLQSKETH